MMHFKASRSFSRQYWQGNGRAVAPPFRGLQWFSFSTDQQRRLENSARLRALRKSAPSVSSFAEEVEHDRPSFNGDATIDGAGTQQSEGQKKKKFVPFFEEIDAIMEGKGYQKKKELKTPWVSSVSKGDRFENDTARPILASNLANSRVSAPLARPSLASNLAKRGNNNPTPTPTLTNHESPRQPPIASLVSKDTQGSNADETSTQPSLASILAKGSQSSDGRGKLPSLSSILSTDRGGPDTSSPSQQFASFASADVSENQQITSAKSSSEQGGASIFDAYPLPELASPPNPNAYDREIFLEYKIIMDEVFTSRAFTKEHTKKGRTEEFKEPIMRWLLRDENTIDCNMPVLQRAVDEGIPSLGNDYRSEFKNELMSQKQAFMEQEEIDEMQYEAAELALMSMGHKCAKRAKSLPLEILWRKVKEAGMVLVDSANLTTFLYTYTTYSGSSWRRSSNSLLGSRSAAQGSILDMLGRPDIDGDSESYDDQIDDDREDLPEEVATFHDLLYEPTEQSLSIQVRSLVANGEAKSAENMIDAFPLKLGKIRGRTYLPVLRLYLDKGNISAALNVFEKMRSTSTVYLEPETWVQLMSAMAENNFFSPDSQPIEGGEDLGYSPAYGPKLFDQIASKMAEDSLEISSASARRLYTAFEAGFRGKEMGKYLEDIHPLAPLGQVNKPAKDGELVASRVLIDSSTAICPRSGGKLRLINLKSDERYALHASLLELSKTSFQEYSANKKHLKGGGTMDALSSFAEWLDTREGEPFTAIVDGANVAYYMQSFNQGKFNFHQIQFIVDELEKMNEKPLVILPHKYGEPYFHVNRSGSWGRQTLDEKERSILESLEEKGILYKVPPLLLDDFYWMLASVSNQSRSTCGDGQYVAPGNHEGKWPGARPMLISNDQMRDHKLELIEPRLFRRWYSCHIVNYNFTAFVDDECFNPEIGFSTADVFSREIQGNPTPLDGVEDQGGTAWHFPVSDWEYNERMCIRIPKK